MSSLLDALPHDLLPRLWAEIASADPVDFAEPRWLWGLLAVPLIVLVLPRRVPPFERVRNFASMWARLLALTALVAATARPERISESPDLAVVLAVDRSSSMRGRGDEALARAEAMLAQLPDEVPVARVALGSDDPAAGPPLAALIDAAVARVPDATTRRVLLVTDGARPLAEAGGDEAMAAAAAAGARLVQVHALRPGEADNAGIVDLSVPLPVEVGSTVTARAVVQATQARRVDLVLRTGDTTLARRGLALQPGRQAVDLEFTAPETGTHALTVALEGGDAWPEDDTRQAWLVVQGEAPVIVVGPTAEPVAQALRRAGLPVDLPGVLPGGLPEGATLLLLGPDLDNWEDHVAKDLVRQVRTQAVDLILAGGPKGLGTPGEKMDPLHRVLPIRFPTRKDEQPAPTAVVFLVDRSESMLKGDKMKVAVSAVFDGIGRLQDDALVGVIFFSDFHDWVVPMTRASQTRDIAGKLSNPRVYGGTNIYGAIKGAWQKLVETDAVVKHIIVLTDGKHSGTHDWDTTKTVAASGVTISTVAISTDADRDDLAELARLGNGRTYYAPTAGELPKILVDETVSVMQTDSVERVEPVRPIPVLGSPLLGPVTWSDVPALQGYNVARPKQTADVALVLEWDVQRALLASWRVGLGSVTVFASELGGGWSRDWLAWDGYASWLGAMVRAVRKRPLDQPLHLQLDPRPEGLDVQLTIYDAMGGLRTGAEPEAVARGASGEVALELSEPMPGHYRGLAAWDGPLLVTATVEAGEGSSSGATRGQAAPPAPDELVGALDDPARLARICQATGGALNPTVRTAFEQGVGTRKEARQLRPLLLWLGLLLLVGDVAIRRVRLPLRRGS